MHGPDDHLLLSSMLLSILPLKQVPIRDDHHHPLCIIVLYSEVDNFYENWPFGGNYLIDSFAIRICHED